MFQSNLLYAQQQDEQDVLAKYKSYFHFPKNENGMPKIYFCGNSLGLQPKSVATAFQQELETWQNLAVEGYFKGKNPWLKYQDYLIPTLAKLVGALDTEVTAMNTLTVNLHLLLLSFYKPTATKYKIIMEAGAFPSDQYAIETLLLHFGINPNKAIIEIAPRPGENILQTADILQVIQQNKNELAMVLMGGINYYTGQLYNMQLITQETHKANAIAAFDLAHVVGNLPLQLHNWDVDFAVWCGYKYLNGGPGCVGGLFVHEKFSSNIFTKRLGGWWGNDEKIRFKMEKGFVPKANASGWNISTAQVMNMVALKASLQIFDEVGMDSIRKKSVALTGYLEYLLHQINNLKIQIITPSNPDDRGAQLSLFFPENGREIHEAISKNNIVVDYREPGVIRFAPAPLYCSFQDVFVLVEIIKNMEGLIAK